MSLAAYQNSQDLNVLSASPVELVRLLYRGAIGAVRTARENLEQGDIRGRSRQITKACSIIEELTVSLDKGRGGKVAADLAELYVYMHRRLIEANIEQIGGPLVEVEKLLQTLLEAWQQIPDEQAQPVREERPTVPTYGSSVEDDYVAFRPSVHLSA